MRQPKQPKLSPGYLKVILELRGNLALVEVALLQQHDFGCEEALHNIEKTARKLRGWLEQKRASSQ